MPFIENRGARVFYEDNGAGPVVIAAHGMMSPGYWSISGVAGLLGLDYRVVSFDLRGHGRTVSGADEGFDVDTIATDIDAIADALGADRFHLLGHATGGMAALRYAMSAPERLHSLIVMDSSSETRIIPADAFQTQAGIIEKSLSTDLYDMMLASHAGTFLARLESLPNRARVVATVRAMFAANEPAVLGRFMRSFFTDADRYVERLRQISCPTLAVVGEDDPTFIEPMRAVADAVVDGEFRVLPGIGHMTAFEEPGVTVDVIKRFLDGAEVRAHSHASGGV